MNELDGEGPPGQTYILITDCEGTVQRALVVGIQDGSGVPLDQRSCQRLVSRKVEPSQLCIGRKPTVVGDALGLALRGDSGLATSNGAGSHSASFELRSAVLKGALVGNMGVTSLESLEVLLLLVTGVRNSKSCQAQNNGLVEDHGDCRPGAKYITKFIVRSKGLSGKTVEMFCLKGL